GGSWRRRPALRSSPAAVQGRQDDKGNRRVTGPAREVRRRRARTRRSCKTKGASRLAAEGSPGPFSRPLSSLHAGSRGTSIELHFSIAEGGINAHLRASAAVHVGKNCNQIATLQRAGHVGARALHGCFLADEAIEAATSVAILIWGSRSVSWYLPATNLKSVQLSQTVPSS